MLALIGSRRICCTLSCHIWRLRLSGVSRLADLTTLYLLAVQGRFAQLIAPSSFNEIMFKALSQLRAGGLSRIRSSFDERPFERPVCRSALREEQAVRDFGSLVRPKRYAEYRLMESPHPPVGGADFMRRPRNGDKHRLLADQV
jgi:hypothetical protein